MSRFPAILKSLRSKKGLTQAQLGKLLGISKSAVSMYECGSREPDFETMEAIADFFNVNISTLYGRDNVDCSTILSSGNSFTESEIALVLAYRKASEDDRTVVDAALRKYLAVDSFTEDGEMMA